MSYTFDTNDPASWDEINKLRKKVFLNRKKEACSLEKKLVATAKIRFEPRILGRNLRESYPTGSNFCKNIIFYIDEKLYDEIASDGKINSIKETIKNEISEILPDLNPMRERVENVTIDMLESNGMSSKRNPMHLIEPDKEWLAGLDLTAGTLTPSHEKVAEESKAEEAGQRKVTMPSEPKVFIVHGHDDKTLDELELLLRRMNVKPIILQNIDSGGDTLIEALEKWVNAKTDLVVVLMTPDDLGRVDEEGSKEQSRARQNVILEMGMAIGGVGRKKVFIIMKGKLETPSDIAGVVYNSYNHSIKEVSDKLRERLKNLGFDV